MNKFVAIDVETATSEYSSICQIGWAIFENGKCIERGSTYLNPKVDFFENTWIHNIDENTVVDSPTFPEFYEKLKSILNNLPIFHYSHFDKNSIRQACEKWNLEMVENKWIDVMRIARRRNSKLRYSGYSLVSVAREYGIPIIKHHDAEEDALVAGYITLKLSENIDINQWDLILSNKSELYDYSNELYELMKNLKAKEIYKGTVVTITGTMENGFTRTEVNHLLESMGFIVKDTVTKKNTFLVLGIEDEIRNKGYQYSTKHRKAIELNKQGYAIKIINLGNFLKVIESEDNEYLELKKIS